MFLAYLSVAEAGWVKCANLPCNNVFYPEGTRKEYCSIACRNAIKKTRRAILAEGDRLENLRARDVASELEKERAAAEAQEAEEAPFDPSGHDAELAGIST